MTRISCVYTFSLLLFDKEVFNMEIFLAADDFLIEFSTFNIDFENVHAKRFFFHSFQLLRKKHGAFVLSKIIFFKFLWTDLSRSCPLNRFTSSSFKHNMQC